MPEAAGGQEGGVRATARRTGYGLVLFVQGASFVLPNDAARALGERLVMLADAATADDVEPVVGRYEIEAAAADRAYQLGKEEAA